MFKDIRVQKSSRDTEIYYGIDELEIREVNGRKADSNSERFFRSSLHLLFFQEPTTTPAITTTKPRLNLKIFLPAILVPSLVLLVFLIIGLVVYVKRPALCSAKTMNNIKRDSIPMKSRNLVSPS